MRIAACVWLVGLGLFGCGLERIDFDPTPVMRDGGVDAGPPPRHPSPALCFGDVSDCAGLAPAACSTNPHCTYTIACAPRLDFRCSSLREEGECRQVPGCRFDDLLDACTGEPAPGTCEALSGSSCDVASACERVETPRCVPRLGCAQTPIDSCATVPGCSIRCPSRDVACGDVCVDLATNADHCGSCGAYCSGKCEDGVCYAYGPCTNDIDCVGFDDGNACTGVLVCVGGGCQRTPAVTCDDGIECTSDRCDPATGACRHDPRDGFCPLDQACDATTGCGTTPSCTSTSCPAGEFCALGPVNSYCRPTGEGVVGATCDSGFDCVDDLQCVNVSDGDDVLGVCGRGCSASTDCTTGERCLGGACSMRCRPLTTDTVCPPDFRCDIAQGVTLCVDGRLGLMDGGRCADHRDCAHGHLCIIEGSARTCRAVCDLDGSRTCPSPYRCFGLEPAVEVYGREYGACLR